MIADLPTQQATGVVPQLTDRERRRAAATVPAPDAGRYLAVESGDEVVLIALAKPVTRLGRGLSTDVTLEDAAVSRRHALVVQRGERTMLLDDRSRNGTWLNDERVTEAQLHDGDMIAIGSVRMRFLDVPG